MAINKTIMEFLKKHRFDGKTIEFVARMNEKDKTTVTDVENSISQAFLKHQYKDIAALMEAIFDDDKGGVVSYNEKTKKYIYTLKNVAEDIEFKHDKSKHVVSFVKGSKKVDIELSTKAGDKSQWVNIREQIEKQLNKFDNIGDFLDFVKALEKNTK